MSLDHWVPQTSSCSLTTIPGPDRLLSARWLDVLIHCRSIKALSGQPPFPGPKLMNLTHDVEATSMGADGKAADGIAAVGMLVVEFLGERRRVVRGSRLTFGRVGDISLDTNSDLPIVVGSFTESFGLWWIVNESFAVDMRVIDRQSDSHLLLAPQGDAPIGFSVFDVRLVVGRASYELSVSVDADSAERGVGISSGDRPRAHRSQVSLNHEQRQLLTVLAEPQLLGGHHAGLPTNAEAASRVGWRITKFNRKLDHLCLKFEKLGVHGLRGNSRRLASGRRQTLVDYCIAARIITIDDLAALPCE